MTKCKRCKKELRIGHEPNGNEREVSFLCAQCCKYFQEASIVVVNGKPKKLINISMFMLRRGDILRAREFWQEVRR